MKNNRIVLLIVFFFSYAAGVGAQNMYNRVDSLGFKQGMWLEFKIPFNFVTEYVGIKVPESTNEYYYLTKDRDRKYFPIYECVGEYRNGLKTGVWNEYYGSDTIKSRIKFKEGVPFGNCKTYWGTGGLKEEFTISTWDSISIKAYNIDGDLIIEEVVPKAGVIRSIYED